MNNQIYFRIGKPSRFKEPKRPGEATPIKTFIIKWTIIITLLYFFLDDAFRFLLGVI